MQQKIEIDDVGSEVTYYPKFINEDMCIKLIEELSNPNIPWRQGEYNMYGNTVKTPRLLCAMCDDNFDIAKSYNITKPIEWTENVKKIRDMINEHTKMNMQYAQLNRYRNGNDYIGPHADKEMKPNDIIASISLGETRKFVLTKKEDIHTRVSIELASGSLLIMNDKAGKIYWKHSIPKSKCNGERFNITFRPK